MFFAVYKNCYVTLEKYVRWTLVHFTVIQNAQVQWVIVIKFQPKFELLNSVKSKLNVFWN